MQKDKGETNLVGSVKEVWLFEMLLHEIADQHDHVVGKGSVFVLFQQQCDRRAFLITENDGHCETLIAKVQRRRKQKKKKKKGDHQLTCFHKANLGVENNGPEGISKHPSSVLV